MFCCAGTLHFMAPEVLSRRKCSFPVDWWAYGVTIYETCTREKLFRGPDRASIKRMILESPIDLHHLDNMSVPLADLVRHLLKRNIEERLGSRSAAEIKGHQYFANINWATLSTSDNVFKPAALPVGYTLTGERDYVEEQRLFYGDELDVRGRYCTVSDAEQSVSVQRRRSTGAMMGGGRRKSKRRRSSGNSGASSSIPVGVQAFIGMASLRKSWLCDASERHPVDVSRASANDNSSFWSLTEEDESKEDVDDQ